MLVAITLIKRCGPPAGAVYTVASVEPTLAKIPLSNAAMRKPKQFFSCIYNESLFYNPMNASNCDVCALAVAANSMAFTDACFNALESEASTTRIKSESTEKSASERTGLDVTKAGDIENLETES